MTLTPTNFGDFNFGDFNFGGMPSIPGGSMVDLPTYSWQVLVRKPDLTIKGELETIDFELHSKHRDIGTWAVDYEWDGDSEPGATLLQPGAGLVFVVNEKTVMSGLWTKPVISRQGDKRTFQIGGLDDLLALQISAVQPDPALDAPPYNTQAQDIRGPAAAESVIKGFVNANIGPGARADRQIPGLAIEADTGRGSSVKGIGDWTKQLDVLVQELALAGGLGYRIVQTGAGLQFQVLEPVDKTSTVIFSVDLGNVSSYTVALQRPTANFVYALGAGTGTARTVRQAGDAVSIAAYGRRIESVIDVSNTTDSTAIDQAIANELAAKASQFSIEVAALDTKGHQWLPVSTVSAEKSYDVGDSVGVIVDGFADPVSDTITDVGVKVTGSGAEAPTQIVPTVGSPSFKSVNEWAWSALAKQNRALQAQIRAQQGS